MYIYVYTLTIRVPSTESKNVKGNEINQSGQSNLFHISPCKTISVHQRQFTATRNKHSVVETAMQMELVHAFC